MLPADSSSTRDVVVQYQQEGQLLDFNWRFIQSLPHFNRGSSSPVSDSQTRFACEFVNGQYTVMYQPESQPNQSFPATPAAMGDGWTSERRCNEISQRLESYRPDGIELRTDVENNYNTVREKLKTTRPAGLCSPFLPVKIRLQPAIAFLQNLTVADNGEQTTATYVNRGRQGNEISCLIGSSCSRR